MTQLPIFQFIELDYDDYVYTAILVNDNGVSYWSVVYMGEDDEVETVIFTNEDVYDFIVTGYWDVLL